MLDLNKKHVQKVQFWKTPYIVETAPPFLSFLLELREPD